MCGQIAGNIVIFARCEVCFEACVFQTRKRGCNAISSVVAVALRNRHSLMMAFCGHTRTDSKWKIRSSINVPARMVPHGVCGNIVQTSQYANHLEKHTDDVTFKTTLTHMHSSTCDSWIVNASLCLVRYYTLYQC